MKTSNDRKLPLSPSLRAVSALSDAQVQDEFDDLVMRASEGDSRAIASIAVALGPMLRRKPAPCSASLRRKSTPSQRSAMISPQSARQRPR